MISKNEISADIFLCLLQGQMYGLELKKAIERDREIVLDKNHFHKILRLLESSGKILCTRKEVVSGRERKYYGLTSVGKTELTEVMKVRKRQSERWRQYAQ